MPASFDLSNLNVGQWAVIGLSLVLIGWLVAGIVINRREGLRAHAWLSGALDGYTAGSLSWVDLATAASVLKPKSPDMPVEKLECVFALERRENLPMWLFHRAAGKRDALIIRAALRRSPSFEAHLIPAGELGLIASLTQGRDPPLARTDDPGGYSLFTGGEPGAGDLAALREAGPRFQGRVLRVSLRPERPQLIFHARLDALRSAPPGSLARTLEEIAGGL